MNFQAQALVKGEGPSIDFATTRDPDASGHDRRQGHSLAELADLGYRLVRVEDVP